MVMDYTQFQNFPPVRDGKFELADLAYGTYPSRPDDPMVRYFVIQKFLWDRGFCFLVTPGNSIQKTDEDLGFAPNQGRIEKAMAHAIARSTRCWKSHDKEDRTLNLPTGRQNAIAVKVLDSDFLVGIGRSLFEMRNGSDEPR